MKPVMKRSALLALIGAAGLLTACATQPPAQTTPTPPTPEVSPNRATPRAVEPPEARIWTETPPGSEVLDPDAYPADGVLQTIYFDYDQSEIRPDQRAKLEANAQYMRANTRFRVLIAGHSDERGTREYNMALGERRAGAAMMYMTALGIPRDRVDIISFGEERPAAAGSTESAWAQNRRAEFRPVAGRDDS